MECDIAVLGGGPGGYTAAIRAGQLGARTVCIEKEPELGGTCLRIGCIPTKAWVQTAFAIKEAEHTFAKLGVQVGAPSLDFATANEWKSQVVHQMTQGVASLFKANGVEWVKGTGRFKDAHTIAVEGAEDVSFKSAIVATGSFPLWPPIDGLDSPRCVDSEALVALPEVPKRLFILGGGIIGCEFASIFRRFGSEVTIIEMLPRLIPAEDEDASKELAKQFGKRGIDLHLEKQCTKVEESAGGLTVYFGDGETVECDLMLVAVGRGPTVENLGLEQIGVEFDKRKGVAADEHRRTTVGHIYAVGDCAGYWQLALTEGRVRELPVAGAVADGVDVADGRPAVLVRGDPFALVELDADLLEAEVLDRGAAADGDEHQVALDRLAVAEVDGQAAGGFLDLRALLLEVEVDPALAELLRELLRGVFVLGRDQPRQHLDDRHLGAEAPEDRGELAADDPAAQYDEPLRHLGLREQSLGVDAARRVEAVDRRPARTRARRHDRALEADVLCVLDRDRVGVLEAAGALDPLDAVGLEEAGDALRHLVDDL